MSAFCFGAAAFFVRAVFGIVTVADATGVEAASRRSMAYAKGYTKHTYKEVRAEYRH
jgi:acid phosphatase family membrane protein YuiD